MPGGVDEDAVAVPASDHLGVAGDQRDAGAGARPRRAPRRHAADRRQRRALLQDERSERYSGVAPLMARSLTVPLTARSPMLPPGKNSGRTTKESVENASRGAAQRPRRPSRPARRRPRRRTPAGTGARPARPDMAPPPPWPMTMVGRVAQRQPGRPSRRVRSVPDWAQASTRSPASRRLQPAVEVVGGAGALGRDHRRAERVARACTPCRTPGTRAA